MADERRKFVEWWVGKSLFEADYTFDPQGNYMFEVCEWKITYIRYGILYVKRVLDKKISDESLRLPVEEAPRLYKSARDAVIALHDEIAEKESPTYKRYKALTFLHGICS